MKNIRDTLSLQKEFYINYIISFALIFFQYKEYKIHLQPTTTPPPPKKKHNKKPKETNKNKMQMGLVRFGLEKYTWDHTCTLRTQNGPSHLCWHAYLLLPAARRRSII